MSAYKLLPTLLLLCVTSFFVSGQQQAKAPQTYGKSALYNSNQELIYLEFAPEAQKSQEDLIKLWHKLYTLSQNYSFDTIRSIKDELGMVHIRYQLYYNSIPVEGSELIMHAKDHRVVSFNGHIYRVNQERVRLTKEEAIQYVLKAYPSQEYKWNSAHEEMHLKEMEGDPNATYYPQPHLVYVAKNLDYTQAEMHLCYKMDVYSDAPLFRKWIYVSASSGEIIADEDRICHANSNGNASTRYSGNQTIVTDSLGVNSFRLRETSRGNGIETYNMQNGNKYGSAVDFTDTDNNWNNVNAAQDEIATDAHWGAEKTWDYYWNIHSRNSFDDNGAKIRSFVHYGNRYNNAFWNGSVMTYGDGDSTRFYPLTSIDVCSHEVSHAVTTNSANLIYRNESGALNESFSDIFGNAVEFFAKPTQFSWAIGEDITPNGTGIRNMKTPNSKGHPDTYKGTYWRTGTGDNGGVHSNSGVQNHWFYLLSNGGVGTNDNSAIYRVDSIGMYKAEKIAYRNLTVYLTRSSTYSDARLFAIQSASDLYGSCSKELIATTNAWHACGVGEKYDSTELSIAFTGDSLFCRPPAAAAFTNLSVNAKNYTWTFGDGASSNLANPIHNYLQYGTFSVKLVGEGCFNGQKDSFEKSAWIVVDSNFDICNSYIMPYRSWDSVYDCKGMIYDNGGEDEYRTLVRDTFTVHTTPSDSIVIEFLDFDYEKNYDYVYLYDGPSPKSPLIARYTGQTLPNGGAPIVAKSGSFTIVHFSDPLVVGRGFKLKFEAHRPALGLTMPNDTTICQGSSVWIKPTPSGGFMPDYSYEWSTGERGDSILFSTFKDTTVYVRFYDTCTDQEILDSIRISVLPELSLSLMNDSLVCYNQVINLLSTPSGGLSSQHLVTWEVGGTGPSVPYSTRVDTTLMAILSDNCSAENDTAYLKLTVRDSITTTISRDTTICEGQSVDIEAFGAGGRAPLQYFWNNGLGAGAKKTVTPVASTDYIVTVSDGCSSPNAQAIVVVLLRDPLDLEVNNDTIICSGNSVDLNATASGGDQRNYTYTWSHGLPNSSFQTVKPNSDQVYKISLYDNCSLAAIEDSIVVTVLPELDVTITGQDTVCFGENIQLEAIPNGGLSTAYLLSWDNGLGTGARVNVNPQSDTTYRVILSDGCTVRPDTAYKKIIVREPLKVSIDPSSVNLCEGDSVLISASGTGGIPSRYEFQWDNGLGTGDQIKVSPNFDTRYTVILTDNCSNYTDTSASVVVLPNPNISFDIYPNPACTGQDITFVNNTTDKQSMNILWDFGDGNISTDLDPTHIYNTPGAYTVKLRAENSYGCIDSLETVGGMRVEQLPLPGMAGPAVLDILDANAQFENRSSFATSYLWDFGDGNTSTQTDPSHRYTDTGFFFVKLTVYNDIGCQNSGIMRLYVRDVFQMYIPNAFTPNEADNLNNELSLNAKGVKEFEMRIFSRWGEELYFSTDWTEAWDGKDKDGKILPAGVYFYAARVVDVNRVKHELKGSINLIR